MLRQMGLPCTRFLGNGTRRAEETEIPAGMMIVPLSTIGVPKEPFEAEWAGVDSNHRPTDYEFRESVGPKVDLARSSDLTLSEIT